MIKVILPDGMVKNYFDRNAMGQLEVTNYVLRESVKKWCLDNLNSVPSLHSTFVTHPANKHVRHVQWSAEFSDEKEALLFKLTWCDETSYT